MDGAMVLAGALVQGQGVVPLGIIATEEAGEGWIEEDQISMFLCSSTWRY